MRRSFRFAPLAALLAVAPSFAEDPPPVLDSPAPEPAAATVTYKLDPAKGLLAVLIKYDRNSSLASLGHDHVIVATGWSGTVKWNAADASQCSVDIVVPTSGLVVDPAGMRAKFGLEGETDAGDKDSIRNNFLGKGQLNASAAPNIEFHGKTCDAATGTVKVTGAMSIRGVSHNVTATMKVDPQATTFTANGSFAATTTDWGFDPFSAILGQLKNDKALAFTVNVVGAAQ